VRDNAVLVHLGATSSNWHRGGLLSGRELWGADDLGDQFEEAAMGGATKFLPAARVLTMTPVTALPDLLARRNQELNSRTT